MEWMAFLFEYQVAIWYARKIGLLLDLWPGKGITFITNSLGRSRLLQQNSKSPGGYEAWVLTGLEARARAVWKPLALTGGNWRPPPPGEQY